VRTLIVDDSPVIRLLLNRILASYSECELAKDGQEGIDAYSRGVRDGMPFDLICLDLAIPSISGREILEKIRALEAASGSPVRSRILVITSSAEKELVDTVRRQGADGYLVKPVERLKLIDILKTFGLLRLPPGAAPCEDPVQCFETLLERDAIPPSSLTGLMQRMAASMQRQLAGVSALSAASAAKETPSAVEDSSPSKLRHPIQAPLDVRRQKT